MSQTHPPKERARREKTELGERAGIKRLEYRAAAVGPRQSIRIKRLEFRRCWLVVAKSKRGGARPGAGRPAVDGQSRRVAELERLVEEIRRDRQAAADAGRWHAVAPLWSAELRVRQLIEQVEATPRERSIEEILGGKG